MTTGVGQTLEKLTIDGYDKSWAEISINTVFDGTVSYGLGKLPGVKGITSGQNSWASSYNLGIGRLRNGMTGMNTKVVAKGIGSGVVSGLPLDGYYGIKQYSYDKVKSLIA